MCACVCANPNKCACVCICGVYCVGTHIFFRSAFMHATICSSTNFSSFNVCVMCMQPRVLLSLFLYYNRVPLSFSLSLSEKKVCCVCLRILLHCCSSSLIPFVFYLSNILSILFFQQKKGQTWYMWMCRVYTSNLCALHSADAFWA